MSSIARLIMALLPCLLLAAAAAPAEQAAPARPRVAILLFNGVEVIDYAGPFEVFAGNGWDVYTVGRSTAPVTSAMGLTVVPKYDFSNAPKADILVVPGGGVDQVRTDPETLAWIRRTSAAAGQTMSVCNGALILADAGLLDGLSATTTAHWIAEMAKAYPKIHLVSDQRFVDNGRIITTAGLSAGIDGALHLVERLDGKGQARQVALDLEYNWQPDHPFVRAALADKEFPDFDLAPVGDWTVADTQGDRTHWRLVVIGGRGRRAADIMDYVASRLKSDGKWTQTSTRSSGARLRTGWAFTGRDGRPWDGEVLVDGANAEGDLVMTFAVAPLGVAAKA